MTETADEARRRLVLAALILPALCAAPVVPALSAQAAEPEAPDEEEDDEEPREDQDDEEESEDEHLRDDDADEDRDENDGLDSIVVTTAATRLAPGIEPHLRQDLRKAFERNLHAFETTDHHRHGGPDGRIPRGFPCRTRGGFVPEASG